MDVDLPTETNELVVISFQKGCNRDEAWKVLLD